MDKVKYIYAYDPHPPSIVKRRAAKLINATSSIQMHWQSPHSSKGYFVYLCFAEIQRFQSNDYRAFNFRIDGELLDHLVVPKYLSTLTILKQFLASHATNNYHNLTLVIVDNSTLPPIINGIEIYRLMDFSKQETYKYDGTSKPTCFNFLVSFILFLSHLHDCIV